MSEFDIALVLRTNQTVPGRPGNFVLGNGHAFPFGIFEDDDPVGFLMIGYDVDDSYENPPHIAYGNYSIWRLICLMSPKIRKRKSSMLNLVSWKMEKWMKMRLS